MVEISQTKDTVRFDIIITDPERFNPIMTELLQLVIDGKSYKEISRSMELDIQTVKTYMGGKESLALEENKLGLLGIAEKLSGLKGHRNKNYMIKTFIQHGILSLIPVQNSIADR